MSKLKYLPLLACAFFLSSLFSTNANAQTQRNFTERASFDANGNIALVGNTLFTCAAGGDCAQVQNGTTPGLNGRDMVYVDVDPSAPGSYANSSTAQLNLPNGSTVLYAGLYWGGRAGGNTASRSTIYMKTPGSSSWNTITASQIDTFSSDGSGGSRPYQAFADVTSTVSSAGNGTYSVGGMTAVTGNDLLGFYGGWSLAVIYQDNNQSYKRLNLFDGAARVTGTTTVTVTATGLVTPNQAGFETYIGALVWEGDNSIIGDSFIFEGTSINQTLNPSTDFWNSSITSLNTRVTSKNPDYVNQLSMDLDLIDVTGLLAPSSTDADIQFTTNGDSYFPNYLTFATELFVPDYSSTMTKTATDLNGGGVVRGDVIEYTISFENTGTDDAINTVLTDSIPNNTTYVAGSMEIVSSDTTDVIGSLSDSSGNDQGEFDGSQIIVNLGAGANSANGGTYQPNEGAVVRFRVTINNDAPIGTITNTATIVANSPTLPTTDFTSNATADVTITDITPPAAASCTVAPNPANNGTSLTATCTGVESGGSVSIPGYTCGAEAGNQVVCTATAGTGPGQVSGDATATTADAAGNTATSNVPFTLDNTPPALGSCTVTPDPANNGTVVTANCTGVEAGATLTIPGYACTDNGSGNWSCTGTVGTAGVDGDETATATDDAGNTATTPAGFTLDNTPPTAAVCTVDPDPANDGTALTATCTGVETGASVSIPGYTCGAEAGNQVVCTATAGTGPGQVSGDATATTADAAGNTSTSNVPFTLDNTPPAIGTCTVTPDPANNGTVVTANCTGVEAGATLTIPGYACTDNGSGNWSCTGTVGTAGVDGDETATATDDAGNTATTPAGFTLDNTPPTAAVCTVDPDPANDGTALTATCTGVETGASVSIPGYTCGAEAGNQVVCTATAGTGPGQVSGDATATTADAAGNTSTSNVPFTLDNTAPTAAVCTVDPNPANDGTALTATCTGVETGASVSIPGYTCGAEAGNQVVCTATAGTGPGQVSGDATATTADAAGNTSTSNVPFTLDNTAPTAAVCTVDPDPANDGTALTATCTGVETGASVSIPGYTCGAEAGNQVVCTATAGTGPGQVSGDATATTADAAGNTSTSNVPFTLDNTAPTAAVCTVDPDPANDGTALTATCTGVETGASVSIPGYTCGAEAGNQVVCTATAGTGPGQVSGDATATTADAAGNTSTSNVPFTLDNTAPTAAVCTVDPNPANDGTALTATCTGVETGASVSIPGYTCGAEAGNQVVCTATAGTGPGQVSGDATATTADAAGNTATSNVPFTLDNTAPAIGTCTVTPDPANNGTVVTANCTGVEAGATLTIPGYVCTDNGSGNWSCTGTVGTAGVDGDETATATDDAGNTADTPATFTLDNTAPPAPVIFAPTNGAPVTGTGEPGATVTVTTPSGATCTAVVQGDGSWSCTLSPTPEDGEDITATQEDEAGNTSPPTTVPGGIDTTAPAAPVINPVNENTDPITGLAEPGTTITLTGVTCDNEPIITNASGLWSCVTATSLPLTPGDLIVATATDDAGNVSQPGSTTVGDSATQSEAPTVNPVADGATEITGSAVAGSAINIDGITCSNSPVTADNNGQWVCDSPNPVPVTDDIIMVTATQTGLLESPPVSTTVYDPNITSPPAPQVNPTDGDPVSGTTIPNGDITVLDEFGTVLCTTTADAAGNFSCSPVVPAPVDGDVLSVIVTDANGNSSGPTQVTVDTVAPAQAVCTVSPDPANNGTTMTATCTGVETDAVVTIPGYACGAEAGNEVICTAIAGQSGVDGDEQATVTDAAGNSSNADAFFTLDNTAPTAAVCTVDPDPANDGTALTATCTGVETGASVSIPGYTCGAEAGNQVVCTATAGTGPGQVSGDATATTADAAGNTSTSNVPFTLDNTAPTAAVCTVDPNPANDGTALTATCTGVETGASVSIPGYTCGAEAGNQVVCTATAGTGPGQVSGDATATTADAAGNTSTSNVPFTLDNTAPTAAVCTVDPDPANDGTALTATCTGVETGASVSIPGYTCGAEAGNQVVCTATAGTGPGQVSGDATATTADAAGNTSTSNVPFTLDNTAPTAAVCTVDPNPANDGTALTATCTGVETGGSVSIPGYTCGAEAGNQVVCTATAGTGPGQVSGDATATTADAAGNTATSNVPFTLDNTAPAIGTCTVTPDPANNGTVVTANCTGVEAGATLTIPGYVCTDNGSGNWSCTGTVGTAGVDGDETATATDDAGNTADTPATFTLDNTAPPAPVIFAPTNGAPVTGTGEPGATVTVTTPSGATCTAVVQGDGSWSCTLSPTPEDGEDITATQEDEAGNTSPPTTVPGGIDTTAPAAPVINPVNENTDPITGLAEPGTTITLTGVTCDNEPIITNASGLWSCVTATSLPLTPGDLIVATATDDAGNVSQPGSTTVGDSATQSEAPTVNPVADGATEITGSAVAGSAINIDGITCSNSPVTADNNGQWVCDSPNPVPVTDDIIMVTATQTGLLESPPVSTTVYDPNITSPPAPQVNPTDGDPVSGTTIPNGDITVLDEFGTVLCTTTADAAGNYSCSPVIPLPAHNDVLSVIVTDANGNSSLPTQVTVDSQAPNAPVCTVTPDPANTGTALTATCTGVETDATVTIPGYSCGMEAGNEVICTATAGQNGVDGDEVATITDLAGNNNQADAFFTLDDNPPAAPVCTVTPNPANNGTALTATCTGVEADATVTIPNYVCGTESGNEVVCTGTAGPGGVTGDETATITDEAGNSATTIAAFTLDNTAPAAPVCTVDPNPANDGTALTATCTGVETGATVTIPNYSCGIESGNVVVCTGTAGPGGVTGDETATIVDVAGNSNTAIAAFTLDNTPPAAPVCTVTPNPANDGTALTATCTGVETDATVTIPNYVCGSESGNQVVCTATAGPGGVTGDETATITDVAGNSATTNVAFTLDNTPPGSPTITAPTDGTTINDNTPLVVGTGEPDSIITVSGPNGESCTTTVDGNGDWSCTLSPALQDGNNTITAVAADEAGNESAADSITVTVLGGQGYVLVVNAPAELVTTEMGGTDTFEVSLPLTPTADVTVNFSSSDTTEGTVAPGSVTFTTDNWDTPVTITVTGVDDAEYDLDQDYQIIIGSLSSADTNYDGFNPDDLDAVNIDDDESPDLSAFMTNCVAGVNPTDTPLYELVISNVGNKDITGAMVNTVFDDTVSMPDWICQPGAGANCGTASGSGDLVDELVDVPVGSQVTFLFDTNVTGQLMDFIDVQGSVTLPVGETDVNPGNNNAADSDLIYQFLFKHSFECNAPGTIQSTQALWESLNPDS